MTSGAQQPTVQTQSREPWAGAQPALSQALGSATTLYNQDTGYQPFADWPSLQAPENPWLSGGLGMQAGLAQGGMPGFDQAYGLGQNMMAGYGGNPGLTWGEAEAANRLTGMQQGVVNNAAQYVDLANRYSGLAGQYGGLAGQYQGVVGQGDRSDNPALQRIIDTNNRRISDKISSSMGQGGTGRYGSALYQDAMARGMAESADPILAADYEARQARKMQALGGIGSAYGGIGSAYGGMGSSYGGELNAWNLYGQANRDYGNLYGHAADRAGNWASQMPGFEQARYIPAQMLQTAGGYEQARSQDAINNMLKYYNASQARPWEQIARLNAIAGGAGGLGGSSVTSTQNPALPLGQRILGGGLAGYGAAGPIGGGLGALAGAFL